MKNIQYYLIHGIDKSREQFMLDQFKRVNIDNEKVKWIRYPNKDELSDELINSILIPDWSITCGKYINAKMHLSKGQISCTYKHYLCIKDIVENNYEYAVIMEDNMYMIEDVPKMINRYIEQLNHLYPDWDILFDNKWAPYIEQPLKDGQLVYPKTNEITNQCHGSTRCAQFYLLNLKCAKKIYNHYIPFNNAPDWWLNDLFRKVNISSYWTEPSNVDVWEHISTA
jgi:GR25 family glycosyltransferase involved in LPS biosynthesis